LLTNLNPRGQDAYDLAMLGISSVCLLAWLAVLRPQGEEIKVMASPRRDPGAILRLTRQLDAINTRLANLPRRYRK